MVSLFVLGALVLEVEAIQDPQTQGHDYTLIPTRNAFNLSNEPPPRKESAPPPEPPKNLDLKFTGIFKLRGVEKARLAVTDTTAKPPETKYFQMPVGDKQGEIEITAIDAKTGLVKLLRNGTPIELSLSNDEHTYKTAVAKAPTKSQFTLILLPDIISFIKQFTVKFRQDIVCPPNPLEFFHVIKSYLQRQSVGSQSGFQFASSRADARPVNQSEPCR